MRRIPFLCSILIAALAILPSCQTLQFYGQAAAGQIEVLRKSRPNDEVIADPDTSPALKRQIGKVTNIRRFATEHLALPGDESYGKYADLGRDHVVWTIYATPEFSLKPKTWFYPFIGEMDYRGYFHEEDAEALARQLRDDGYDVYSGGVDAYSTLGWFYDPLLNTFAGYPDVDLAETLFHELTHRRVFRRGDTIFNESLATVVAEAGVKRWLRHEGRMKELRNYEERLIRRRQFYQEIDRSHRQLDALYSSGRPPAEMLEEKAAILAKLHGQFLELRRRWGGHGLEGWLAEKINNAHIVSLKIYAGQMPRFEALLAECDGDFETFFKKVEHLKSRKEN